jgi:putative alpha-1,2-mannosidase
MSSWYVFNAMGFYTYSPADPAYIVTVPLFDEVKLRLSDNQTFTIQRKNAGTRITSLTCDGKKIDGYFLTHQELTGSKELIITTK